MKNIYIAEAVYGGGSRGVSPNKADRTGHVSAKRVLK